MLSHEDGWAQPWGDIEKFGHPEGARIKLLVPVNEQ